MIAFILVSSLFFLDAFYLQDSSCFAKFVSKCNDVSRLASCSFCVCLSYFTKPIVPVPWNSSFAESCQSKNSLTKILSLSQVSNSNEICSFSHSILLSPRQALKSKSLLLARLTKILTHCKLVRFSSKYTCVSLASCVYPKLINKAKAIHSFFIVYYSL